MFKNFLYICYVKQTNIMKATDLKIGLKLTLKFKATQTSACLENEKVQ